MISRNYHEHQLPNTLFSTVITVSHSRVLSSGRLNRLFIDSYQIGAGEPFSIEEVIACSIFYFLIRANFIIFCKNLLLRRPTHYISLQDDRGSSKDFGGGGDGDNTEIYKLG